MRQTLVLISALFFGLPALALGQDEEIPAAPDSLAKAGNAIVLILPSGGGYEINHQPVPLPDIGQQFRAIYDPRPIKVLLVAWGADRPRSEVDTVVLLAREQGVTVYRIPIDTVR